MYEFLATYTVGEDVRENVRVVLHIINYVYTLDEFLSRTQVDDKYTWSRLSGDSNIRKTLHILYVIYCEDGQEIEESKELKETEDVSFVVDINRSEFEECILDLIKKDSRFSNIREV